MNKVTIDAWLIEQREKEARLVRNPLRKALRVIDMLTCNDAYAENNLLSTIYMVAHSAHGICDNEHSDWKKETKSLYKKLKRNGS